MEVKIKSMHLLTIHSLIYAADKTQHTLCFDAFKYGLAYLPPCFFIQPQLCFEEIY